MSFSTLAGKSALSRRWGKFRTPVLGFLLDHRELTVAALFTVHPVLWAVALIVGALAGVARAWLAHLTVVRCEEEHTRRVELAVTHTDGVHRAAVVRAAGQLAPTAPRRRR